jgi:hypothetical protein
MTTRLPLVLGAVGLATLLSAGSAEAGHVHFSGGVHFGGHAGVHWAGGGVSVHSYSRPYWNRGWGVGGHIWVGGYYYPRPYYYYYYPEYVPSYYGYYNQSYYPCQPAASAPGIVAAVAPQPELPTFGLGVFAGGTQVRDKDDSKDLGLLGRLRLTTGLLVEGEIARTSYPNDQRVDRRLGGSLIYEFGAYNTFAPYVLGGLGVQQADVDGMYQTTQDYAEIGIGLRWALSTHFHLTFDVRAGSRNTVSSNQPDSSTIGTAARTVAPPSGSATDNNNENYTRARLAAVLMF